ncbi:DNA primase family protein [Mycolicibacterium sphagni]|uniref:DNA primase family protein n=1 Tax=Mycolicibacterium sphagni TaxID=1786 RepID=UPI0021F37789|nr:phage/plasmid primase, P4 family [Mycolicibacterium sphagni]MCV7176763.1 NTP-binding protein [Mycolicibacterium sphagni]
MTVVDENNVVPIGAADKAQRPKPAPDRPVYPSPDAPLDVARKLYKVFRTDVGRTLVCHRGDWMRWNGQQWSEWDADHLRSTVYKQLGDVDYDRPIRKGGEIVDYERTRWNPNRNKVANVLEALAAVAHLRADIDAPAWIGDHDCDARPNQMIACTNGLLSLADRQLHPHTPAFYNHVSVPFAYQPDAPKPKTWLKFLDSVWPNDPASVALLQEWIGYIVTGRTDMQKILLLVGPTRSGKGTIARMLRILIGRGHIAGPTLASLGTNFGLAPLLGKVLAIIADARLSGRDIHTIVERLLSISGEDVLTVDRKFRDPWSGKLPTRIIILSNEIPRFSDASGAVANRLMVLQMRNSFLGKEDRGLDARIATELPGILNWALEGLDRLDTKGRFTVPKSSGAATTMLMDLASPTSAFVRDCCTLGHGVSVERDRLYTAWKRWCDDNGHEPGSQATFGRNLSAVIPDLGTERPRVDGKPIRYYTHIALLGGSPGSLVIEAGQDPATDPGSVDQNVDQRSDVNQPTLPDPGSDPGTRPVNLQVNASDPGDPGNSAFSVVLKDGKRRALRSGSAARWFHDHIADLRTQGRTIVRSADVYTSGHASGFGVNNLRQAAANHPDLTTVAKDGRTVIWDITVKPQPQVTS